MARPLQGRVLSANSGRAPGARLQMCNPLPLRSVQKGDAGESLVREAAVSSWAPLAGIA